MVTVDKWSVAQVYLHIWRRLFPHDKHWARHVDNFSVEDVMADDQNGRSIIFVEVLKRKVCTTK